MSEDWGRTRAIIHQYNCKEISGMLETTVTAPVTAAIPGFEKGLPRESGEHVEGDAA